MSPCITAKTGVDTMHATRPQLTTNSCPSYTLFEIMAVRRKRLCNGLGRLTAITHSVAPVEETNVHTFCNTLIDYVATGHFKLYAYILSLDTRRYGSIQSLAKDYYPVVAKSTELALLFSDRHTASDGHVSKRLLSIELSVLEETLTQRFIIEDRLIERLKDISTTYDLYGLKKHIDFRVVRSQTIYNQ